MRKLALVLSLLAFVAVACLTVHLQSRAVLRRYQLAAEARAQRLLDDRLGQALHAVRTRFPPEAVHAWIQELRRRQRAGEPEGLT